MIVSNVCACFCEKMKKGAVYSDKSVGFYEKIVDVSREIWL